MTEPSGDWAQTVVHLLALADRLEGHGQYNIAKLARASADSLVRRAAYTLDLPHDPENLVSDLRHLLAALPVFGFGAPFAQAMERGVEAMADGRLPLIDETPMPFVCRTCGELAMSKPEAPCPVCGAFPATFQRFQSVYWLDDLGPQEALTQLRSTPVEVADLLAGLSEQRLARQAVDGGWSMRQVVSHLRDAEGVLHSRIRRMVDQNNPTLESLAVFAWASSEENRPPTTAEILQSYRDSRRETVTLLEVLPAWDWWRTGRHMEFGEVTILQQASYFSAHEQTHLAPLVSLRG